MITYNEKKGVLTFTGKDEKLVQSYAKVHKLMFKEVVYLALMNGLAAGRFNEKAKDTRNKTKKRH